VESDSAGNERSLRNLQPSPTAASGTGGPPRQHMIEVEPVRDGNAARNPNFRWLWSGETVSLFGDQIALFALPTYAITVLGCSSVEAGALRAIGTAAYPVLGLLAGAQVARLRRRRVMITADVARFLVFLSVPLAALAGVVTFGQLCVVALIAGMFSVYFDVACQSYLPMMLPAAQLGDGNAKLEMSSAVSRVAGPGLAGLIVGVLGAPTALAANALSFLSSVAGVAHGRCPDTTPRGGEALGLGAQIREGVTAIWARRPLRALTGAAALRNLGMSARQTVLLLFLYQGLRVSPLMAGLVLAAGAMAAVAGAASCRWLSGRLGIGRTLLLTSSEGFAWLFIPLALLLRPLPVVFAIAVASSAWLPIWNANVTTVRQTMTPAHLLSRVHATARTVSLSAVPVGAFVGGLVAELLTASLGTSVGLVVTLCGCGAISLCALPMLTSRSVRQIGSLSDLASAGS
jgi:MFS family permease